MSAKLTLHTASHHIRSPTCFLSRPNPSAHPGLRSLRRVPGSRQRSYSMAPSFFNLGGLFSGGSKENGSGLGWTKKAGCQLAPAEAPKGQAIATFAGGCFWGLQLAYDRVPGVTQSTVGYTGGHDTSPTYDSVCGGRTGHAEAVQVYYDPQKVQYEQLLDCFFEHVDPTTRNRQGGDMGSQYRSAIYYYSEDQKQAAKQRFEAVNQQLSKSAFRRVLGTKVVTELEQGTDYYIAEKYHQKYLEKGGRFGRPQSAAKGATEKIRCYG